MTSPGLSMLKPQGGKGDGMCPPDGVWLFFAREKVPDPLSQSCARGKGSGTIRLVWHPSFPVLLSCSPVHLCSYLGPQGPRLCNRPEDRRHELE